MPATTRTRPPHLPRRLPVYGRIVRIDESYGRTLAVPPLLVLPVAGGAAIVEAIGALLGRALRSAPPGSYRRPVKSLREGPEFEVTPIWIRTADDSLMQLEVHGNVPPSRLMRGDRIRTVAIRPRDKTFPPVAGPIENLTTGRMVRPHPPTAWSHLGLPLLAQAVFGGMVVLFVIACTLLVRR